MESTLPAPRGPLTRALSRVPLPGAEAYGIVILPPAPIPAGAEPPPLPLRALLALGREAGAGR